MSIYYKATTSNAPISSIRGLFACCLSSRSTSATALNQSTGRTGLAPLDAAGGISMQYNGSVEKVNETIPRSDSGLSNKSTNTQIALEEENAIFTKFSPHSEPSELKCNISVQLSSNTIIGN